MTERETSKGNDTGSPVIGYSDSQMPALDIEKAMDAMTDDERYDLFGRYCRHCGSKDPLCCCWNDK